MSKEKMNNKDFIREISKKTGFTMNDIGIVINAGAEVIKENLINDISTAPFQGMVVYPATYKDTITFPRARFGKAFHDLSPIS